jgi:hypothetical protein
MVKDPNGVIKFTDRLSISTKLTSNQLPDLPAGSDYVGLSGYISVSYDYGCVYFDKVNDDNSYYFNNDNDKYYLNGTVIISWKPQVSPILKSSPPSSQIPFPVIQNHLNMETFNDASNSLNVDTVINLQGDIPDIRAAVYNSNIGLTTVITSPLTPLTSYPPILTTGPISLSAGDTFPGFQSKIKADLIQGCVFFDNDDNDPLLLKPYNETSACAGNYWLRFVKIGDWAGKPIPGGIYK